MKNIISIAAVAATFAWTSATDANTSTHASTQASTQTPAQTQTSPTLTWNRIALDTVERAKPSQHQTIRLMAYVSLAQYAALANASGNAASGNAVADVSAQVIGGLFPAQATFVEARHRELQPLATRGETPLAKSALAEAQRDGFVQTWQGQLPQESNTWRSLANPPAPPAFPALGMMRTFLVESPSTFRSAPPPAQDSAQFRKDIAEVRRYTESPTADTTRIAKFYDMTTGTLAGGFWNEQAATLIRNNGTGELQAARVLATMNTAMMDAIATCHDTKYTYWMPRPSQADPAIKPLIGVPNHPAYPSNHSCISTAAATVLAHFFPAEKSRLEGISTEAGLSRIYAGLHYRFDVDAGTEIGRKIAGVAIARHADMLARWTRTLVAQN